MTAPGPIEFTPEETISRPMTVGMDPWDLVGEPVLPARDFAWAVLVISLAVLAVLIFA